jgi:uncharacterized protein with PQ loop repeat
MILFIGYLAIFVGAISLTPQIYQMYRTKKVEDINIIFLLIAVISDILYFIYSIYKKETIFIISIVPPTISHITMIILWHKYKKKIVTDISNTQLTIQNGDLLA